MSCKPDNIDHHYHFMSGAGFKKFSKESNIVLFFVAVVVLVKWHYQHNNRLTTKTRAYMLLGKPGRGRMEQKNVM